ncbi:MAG TPA: hypothetical protein VJH03_11385 [Blastocatellia bacterium]|nr:hypothetical protein [Blastocatellia bacterium]
MAEPGGDNRDRAGGIPAFVDEFLYRNGSEILAPTRDIVELVTAVEADRWGVDEIELWLSEYTTAV